MNNKTNAASASIGDAKSKFDALESIFLAICEAPNSDRDTLLDELCATREVRDQVEELLGADSSSDPLLDQALFSDTVAFKPGERIGNYKLLGELGQGGMGVVYMAEQVEPVRRKVALKVIKAGVDTKQVIARFNAERQALSLMDHPNVAKVLDAGTTENGRPYFVMEMVKGMSITEYCRHKKLSAEQRLNLFVSVCSGIQHAHHKGIIHRDIKPSNVLVAEYDGQPVVKVIDFGVAKATSQPLTEFTIVTGFGELVGTFEYMSPEQSSVNKLDIDTRSDVYSLGVLLYELLTGSTPFGNDRLKSVSLEETLRIIREEDPPKPSVRVSAANSSTSMDSRTKAEVRKQSRQLRGELDWIVMKALDKDRDRRFDSPNMLARDIGRFLNEEAVEASPPSVVYRFRKFARRNCIAMTASAVVAASLVLGLIGTSWQMNRAIRAEAATLTAVEAETDARNAEKVQLAATDEAKRDASAKKAGADALNRFLNKVLSMAGSDSQLSADVDTDPNIKLVTVLDRSVKEIDQEFAKQPLVRASLQGSLAESFLRIGRYDQAEELFEKVRDFLVERDGADSMNAVRAYERLGIVYWRKKRFDEAEKYFRIAWEVKAEKLGEKDPGTLRTARILATVFTKQSRFSEAETIFEDCLRHQREVYGPTHKETVSTMSKLGMHFANQNRLMEAEAMFKAVIYNRTVTVGPTHSDTLDAMNDLALLYSSVESFEKALPLMEKLARYGRAIWGPDHSNTATIEENLAYVYGKMGQVDKAEAMLLALDDFNTKQRGPRHELTLRARSILAGLRLDAGQFELAASLYKEAFESRKKMQGPSHGDTLSMMANLGFASVNCKRFDEGLSLLEIAFRACPSIPLKGRIEQQLLDGYLIAGKANAASLIIDERLERLDKDPTFSVSKSSLRKSIQDLLSLCDGSGSAGEVAKWREALKALESN